MLAGDETGAPVVDLAQKGTGTEVPVLYPEVARAARSPAPAPTRSALGHGHLHRERHRVTSRARAHRRPRISPARRRPAPRARL